MNKFLKSITNDYFEDILVRLAHHSAGIEGNTISLPVVLVSNLRQLFVETEIN